jgi:PadR family transcriptional regulator, regulatory protein AphA
LENDKRHLVRDSEYCYYVHIHILETTNNKVVFVSLEFAILGFLNYEPFTGYALKKMFDTSVRHFWSADQSQIYRTLARLTEEGLAEVERVEQFDRPDRKIYSITPAGREKFIEWLQGPFPMQDPKSGPLVQVFFSGRLSDEEVLAKFQMAAEIFRTILARYDNVPSQIDEYIQKVPSRREQYFWMLTLDLGIRTMRSNLEWAESVIDAVQKKQIPET